MAKQKADPAAATAAPRINPELQRLAVRIDSLRPDPDNARERTPENLAAIKASLQRFGQQAPVVAMPDGTIKAGNGRWLAAKELGWETIAAIRLPKGLEHLADEYALADNRTAELARWNPDRFKALIEKIRAQGGDTKILGFDAQAVRVLLAKLKGNAERKKTKGKLKSPGGSRSVTFGSLESIFFFAEIPQGPRACNA